jgi:hypothetical protein
MDTEQKETEARGIHTAGMRPKDQMGSPERHIEVRDSLTRFSIINSGHAMKSVKEMGGPNVVALSGTSALKTEKGLINRKSGDLGNGLLKVMMSKLSENVPYLKDCTAIGFSPFERVMNTENPKYRFVSKEVLGHIEELLEKWGVVLGGPRGLYDDGVVGVCAMPSCCATAMKFVGYITSKLEYCVAVRDELLPLYKKCADQREKAQSVERRTTLSITQSGTPAVRYQEYVARMTLVQRDEMLKNKREMMTQQMARDAEMAQLRTQLVARDTQIQEQKDERRDLEEQLEEALDNSDDNAHAITAGANIMMANQFTQTQQNYADLRKYIDRIRAEHAAFVLEERRENTSTAASSQQLERVLSDLSDETYGTANSTYDSSDEPEPE